MTKSWGDDQFSPIALFSCEIEIRYWVVVSVGAGAGLGARVGVDVGAGVGVDVDVDSWTSLCAKLSWATIK